MRLFGRRAAVALGLVALVAIPLAAGPAAAAPPESKHDRIVAYWTAERIRSARPREFVMTAGRLAPAAKPVKPPAGGGLATTSGAVWPDVKGRIYRATGRVLFTLPTGNYICSATVATDNRLDISVVLTAGHCAFDQASHTFATNWMFIPEFDTRDTYDCTLAVYGCWTADRLVVHAGFANQSGFNLNAALYDWAFAVVDADGVSSSQLDQTVGSFPIEFRSYSSGTPVAAFGYPAGGKYAGNNDLIYCSNSLGTDPLNFGRTYRLSCDMTGGSSGGPWLTAFAASGDTGTLSSVNSYTYSGITAMHGPKFGTATASTWNVAVGTGSGNAIVP
jgi:V8-like Glu-specific endopeptidase